MTDFFFEQHAIVLDSIRVMVGAPYRLVVTDLGDDLRYEFEFQRWETGRYLDFLVPRELISRDQIESIIEAEL